MRPTRDEYFLNMALLVSSRGTCPRRKSGAVLTNRRNHVLATGYNGPPTGHTHCIDKPCPGANHKSGEGLDDCEAIHAEANALLQCKDVYEIETCYCTASPCLWCVRLLLNTSCRRIVFLEEYPHSKSKEEWLQKDMRKRIELGHGNEWKQMDITNDIARFIFNTLDKS
ncbi:dCMP deaminase family protein [candidate division KSB1 bacterium]|nr:dCMP deaminase family protein [candidate division KSB1 bacterium]